MWLKWIAQKTLASGWRWLWVALLVLLLDGLSKQWIMQHLVLHERRYCLSWFNLVHVKNPGAAFSLLANYPSWHWLFTVAALLMCMLLLSLLARHSASMVLLNVAYALIIGGAIGNVRDRLCYGAVVDFIDLHLASWHWPAFNFADSAICVGCGLLILQTFRRPPIEAG